MGVDPDQARGAERLRNRQVDGPGAGRKLGSRPSRRAGAGARLESRRSRRRPGAERKNSGVAGSTGQARERKAQVAGIAGDRREAEGSGVAESRVPVMCPERRADHFQVSRISRSSAVRPARRGCSRCRGNAQPCCRPQDGHAAILLRAHGDSISSDRGQPYQTERQAHSGPQRTITRDRRPGSRCQAF